ncbi:DapH/DapD/GlmU-related protein [Xanthomonas albilineans]|uniref:DapH/DapD/GlmU-related protein n=1 Tax=Xanthomonas albilineans TaxID=29447 RepID=UPI0005F30644|nr:DapH/DapD/GlmU-related protein [Xanthomonas albilineans]
MSSEKYVIGSGALLRWALAAWAEAAPDTVLHPVDIAQGKDYCFDLDALRTLSCSDATAFVAWDAQFLNLRRQELMGELKARSFKMPPLICRGAQLAASARIGENGMIGAGAIVGPHCDIGFNSWIGTAAVLEHGVKVGNGAWIDAGAFVGAEASIGSHATLGRQVAIAAGVRVGKRCIVQTPGTYRGDIATGTHYLASFATPVQIFNG